MKLNALTGVKIRLKASLKSVENPAYIFEVQSFLLTFIHPWYYQLLD